MKLKIANKLISEKSPCFIIAEAGVNHNGDFELAKKLIDKAKEAGADAVKFQTFKTDNLVVKNFASQYEMLKKLELTEKEQEDLFSYCQKINIIFLSTPYDEESADFLEKLKVPAFKIGSGELTHLPLLREVARKKLPMIISTGASHLKEIKDALRTVKDEGNDRIILLHSTSLYPTSLKDVNLKAMLTLKKEFKFPVGYSDHTQGINVSLAAVVLGARLIEKHFTLDKNLEGPDHKASLEPGELKEMIKKIRMIEKRLSKKEKPEKILKELEIEESLGNGIKRPRKMEKEERVLGWRSIVAKENIQKGKIIKSEMLAVKRPGKGIRPTEIDKFIGKIAKRNIKKDSLIKWQDI